MGSWATLASECELTWAVSGRGGCQEATPKPKNQRSANRTQQFLKIGSGSSENRVDGVASETFEKATPHSVVAFEVANLGLDGTASLATLYLGARKLLGATASDMHGGRALIIVSTR